MQLSELIKIDTLGYTVTFLMNSATRAETAKRAFLINNLQIKFFRKVTCKKRKEEIFDN